MPEWDMEKYRFYIDLPGDFWESGTLLKYLREREVQVRLNDTPCCCCCCVLPVDTLWSPPIKGSPLVRALTLEVTVAHAPALPRTVF
jgi:hypothetical protein